MDNDELKYAACTDGALPGFDTCDVVRQKIRNHLKKSGMTKTAFLRVISENVHGSLSFQVGQLNRFLAMKGPRKGNTCGVYYAAYVFFEHERIGKGKPKTRDRITMEKLYPTGMDTENVRNWAYAPADAEVVIDRFGVVKIRRPDHECRSS
ncbi:hypothetical protein V2A60_002418 [Cordyceps javanica]